MWGRQVGLKREGSEDIDDGEEQGGKKLGGEDGEEEQEEGWGMNDMDIVDKTDV